MHETTPAASRLDHPSVELMAHAPFAQMQPAHLRQFVASAREVYDVARLNPIDRRVLKESVRVARALQQRIELDYQR